MKYLNSLLFNKWISSLFCILCSIIVNAQNNFTINGTIVPSPNKLVVHLFYNSISNKLIHDSSIVIDGKFKFKGSVKMTEKATLIVLRDGDDLNAYIKRTGGYPQDRIGFYLEKGFVEIKVDQNTFRSVTLSGTYNNLIAQKASDLIWKHKQIHDSLTHEIINIGKDTLRKATLMQQYLHQGDGQEADLVAFVKEYPDAYATMDLIKRWVSPKTNYKKAKELFDQLDPDIRNSKQGKDFDVLLNAASSIAIGAEAPNFNLMDTSGVKHSLHEYRGKYVLVDFWASWCGPCIEEMPNVVKAYDIYKAKGLDIVGISLDGGANNSKMRWKQAIGNYNMHWHQLSDLMGWNSPIAKSYMVTSIPANFLLDPTGKIIAKDLRGEDLQKFLNKELK